MAPEYALGQLRPKNRVVPVVQPLRYRVRALAWAAARPGTIRNARSRHKLIHDSFQEYRVHQNQNKGQKFRHHPGPAACCGASSPPTRPQQRWPAASAAPAACSSSCGTWRRTVRRSVRSRRIHRRTRTDHWRASCCSTLRRWCGCAACYALAGGALGLALTTARLLSRSRARWARRSSPTRGQT